jgi:type IV secretory pathway ATPase VirB11/archaellum biosynthesis ATPase
MAENKHNIIIVGHVGAGISAQMQSAMMRDDIKIITVDEAERQGLNIHELARPEPMKYPATILETNL